MLYNAVFRYTRYANVRYSWLPKVQRNLHLSRRAVLAVVQQQLEARPLPGVQLLQLKRRNQRRRKRKKKSQTRIWVSVCSTRELRSSLLGYHRMGNRMLSATRTMVAKTMQQMYLCSSLRNVSMTDLSGSSARACLCGRYWWSVQDNQGSDCTSRKTTLESLV
jgi:hypothetical protein